MSQSPQQPIDTFNQINLNAIKNTKLFQKFMQNKSGLVAGGSATGNNKSMESTKMNKMQEQAGDNQGKYVMVKSQKSKEEGNGKKMVVNFKKELKKEVQNDINTQNSGIQYGQQQKNQSQQSEQQLQSKSQIIRQPPSSYLQKQFPAQTQPTQSIQNRRKRNFNPNTFNNEQPLGNHQFQGENGNLTACHYNIYSEPGRENPVGRNRKLSNERQGVTEIQAQSSFAYNKNSYHVPQQQKYIKVQSSPGRSSNTYPHSYNMPIEKVLQNYQPPYQQLTAISFSDQQYKQKYDQLQKKYDQLKTELKNQSKHRKKQFSQWEHQIQLLKEKLFDVQSREDSLLIQNQRLKEKCESQTLTKMKTQQQNKELTFRIKQLEDQLQMKESIVKQKTDQTIYWKTQVDTMKQQLNGVRLGLEKKMDQYSLLYGDYQIVRKERDNKDFLLEDLRRNITGLVEENSAAKDEIFKLVTKLYQMQQESQVLRNDLKRQQLDTSQIHNYMKDLQQQANSHQNSRDRVQSSYVDRQRSSQQNHYQPHIVMDRSIGHRNQTMVVGQQNREQIGRGSLTEQERPLGNGEKPTRRRGQFAKERGNVTRNQKPQRDQRPLNINQNHHKSLAQERSFPLTQPTTKPSTFISGNKMARIQQICQQLQKIKDMKAMNGAIRRKKIDLERELQQLEEK